MHYLSGQACGVPARLNAERETNAVGYRRLAGYLECKVLALLMADLVLTSKGTDRQP